MSLWHTLRESFDQTLREPRAVCLRGGDRDLAMATLASHHRHGYGFSTRQFGSGEHRLPLTLRFSPWIHGQPRGSTGAQPPQWCEPVFTRGALGPDVIERSIRYNSAGLELNEEVLRTPEADWLWTLDLVRDAYRPFAPRWREQPVALPWRLHLLIETIQPARVSVQSDVVRVRFADDTEVAIALAATGATWGRPVALAEHELEALALDLWATPPTPGSLPEGPCRHVALPLDLSLLPSDRAQVRLAVTTGAADAHTLVAPGAALAARQRVAADWNGWFAACPPPPAMAQVPDLPTQVAGRASRHLPPTWRDADGVNRVQRGGSPRALAPLAAKDVTYAWRKCLALTRLCERTDPTWGRCLSETFTCYYSGSFGWSLPVIGWYAGRHGSAERSTMLRDILAAYRSMQATDGCMPCYVAFNHVRHATPVAAFKHTQQPQIAWSVWQEYRRHGDTEWLAGFAEPLLRFRDFLDAPARDPLQLGLWCQHHHYDGLDMFPTVDGLVLRGDRVLYSAAYGAEQVQFQRALARILVTLGDPRAAALTAAADAAHTRLIDRLWDRERHWFGDILADGRRETVVGMQGLFALAYGLAPADADHVHLRANLEALIAPFGICTVAPEDARYCERFFWRGPVWPASCLYGMAAARRYAPDLLPRMAAAVTRCALAQPNVWECLEPHSGQPALYDEGHGAMPGTSSVVGSYALCAALEIAAGSGDPFALD
jgi:hypothetical protein